MGVRVGEQAVTVGFRESVVALVPGLERNPAYWRFAGYLMFAGGMEGGELLIPAEFISDVEDRKRNGKYSAWRFLQRFQADTGIKLDIRAHTMELCRVVTRVHWPEALRALLAVERRSVGGERVLFSTGAKWRNEHSAKDRALVQAEAIETLNNMGHPPAYDLLNLLNHAAPNRFAAVKKHLGDAHALVDTLALVDSERERQHNILKAIERQAQPFFVPVARSVRIFALNDSLVRLQRDVRKLMTQDWITGDLRAAQLGIVSSERCWGVPEVVEFLRTGESIWRVLCDWMGLEYNDDNKAVLKDGLYALVFGAGRDKLTALFDEALGPGSYRRFKKQRMMRALLLARALQLRKIRREGGAVDGFGTWIDLQYVAVPGKMFAYDTSRSIMALVAQSYELKLLTPVIQQAVACKDSEHGFTLLTWLHDGFTFVAHKRGDTASWCERLKVAVKEQAECLGIETELEI